MNRNLKWRIALIFAVLLGCFYYIYPTARWAGLSLERRKALEGEWARRDAETSGEGLATRVFYSLEKWLRGDPRRILNLGLDLRGGMHLVLQVETAELTDDAKRDAVPRALEIIRNRVDEFGVAEPSIYPEGRDRIVVQLPGIDDPRRAIDLIGKTALLEFKLVAEDALTERPLDAVDAKRPLLSHLEDDRGRTSEGVGYTSWHVLEAKGAREGDPSPRRGPEARPDGYGVLLGRRSVPRTKTDAGRSTSSGEPISGGLSLKNAQLAGRRFNQPS